MYRKFLVSRKQNGEMITAILIPLLLVSAQASKLGSLVTEKCPEWGEISADCYAKQLDGIIAGISQGERSMTLLN
ncbi:hypothetical protein B566_EDAN001830 [Ephemera danica]|nr:hypothetical protein B566_EDAN001830 [Ephemera danica]